MCVLVEDVKSEVEVRRRASTCELCFVSGVCLKYSETDVLY